MPQLASILGRDLKKNYSDKLDIGCIQGSFMKACILLMWERIKWNHLKNQGPHPTDGGILVEVPRSHPSCDLFLVEEEDGALNRITPAMAASTSFPIPETSACFSSTFYNNFTFLTSSWSATTSNSHSLHVFV